MRADCGTDQESSSTGGQTAAGRGGEQRSIRGPHDNWMTDSLWLTPTAIPSAQARSRFGLLSTGCFDVRSRSLHESASVCVDETFSKQRIQSRGRTTAVQHCQRTDSRPCNLGSRVARRHRHATIARYCAQRATPIRQRRVKHREIMIMKELKKLHQAAAEHFEKAAEHHRNAAEHADE